MGRLDLSHPLGLALTVRDERIVSLSSRLRATTLKELALREGDG